jgi:hypothetical protein
MSGGMTNAWKTKWRPRGELAAHGDERDDSRVDHETRSDVVHRNCDARCEAEEAPPASIGAGEPRWKKMVDETIISPRSSKATLESDEVEDRPLR